MNRLGPRVAFVVQRYGLEVSGGAELLCRQVVERLEPHARVEVLTSCAEDYVTWENVYPAGKDKVNGIPVHRFPTTRTREKAFHARTIRLRTHRHTLQDEMDWLHAQGPVVPDLLRYLVEHHSDYDAFVFFTYIYYPTALGLRLVADRALLVPTAHDEPSLHFDVYNALFHSPRAILYNTVEEKRLLEGMFGVEHIPNRVIGAGVTAPEVTDPDRFCRRYGIQTPYVVYVGRVSTSKNCHVLLDHFERYKAVHPDPLTLVLVGKVEIPIPARSDIVALGFVPDEDKFDAISGARLFLLPSRFESLSLAFLESLALGTPVLCDGTSAVLRGHCLRSNAALYYENDAEFEASLHTLLHHPQLCGMMAKRGRTYVEHAYKWERIIAKYRVSISQVTNHAWW
ncbi:MAG: glycosyltransferase family 4 protein [Anaerolineae bacterium]|nr:glycosyltransferase family 4 protein [Anaerolineae bacterium]